MSSGALLEGDGLDREAEAVDALEATRYALEMLRLIDDRELTPLEQREVNRLIAGSGYLIDSLEWRRFREGST